MKSYEFIYVYLDFFLYYIANIDATSRSTTKRARLPKASKTSRVYKLWILHYPYHPWCLYSLSIERLILGVSVVVDDDEYVIEYTINTI